MAEPAGRERWGASHSFDLLIPATEGIMDYDATCLVAGPASPLLNLIGFLIFCAVGLCITRGSGGGGHHQLYSFLDSFLGRRGACRGHARSVKSVPSSKRKLTRFCARVDRCCVRMNSGLVAVTVVLAATTLFVSVLRVSDEITRDGQLGKLPFIEMSTDGPNTGISSMSD
jgi:hypothetical protein